MACLPFYRESNRFMTHLKMLQPFITPALSRFISARLFSVPQVENEVKRSPLCGCCWDSRSRNWWIKKVQKEEFSAAFQKLYDHASLYICQWSLFWIKKKVCLRFLKKSVLNLRPHCVHDLRLCLCLHAVFRTSCSIVRKFNANVMPLKATPKPQI